MLARVMILGSVLLLAACEDTVFGAGARIDSDGAVAPVFSGGNDNFSVEIRP